jgi:hypothetical protein
VADTLQVFTVDQSVFGFCRCITDTMDLDSPSSFCFVGIWSLNCE